ncbi:MAG: 5-(carboxyamino)imidazole ribonucleotide mutase [bacterium]
MKKNALVGIVMGSDSDLVVVKGTFEILEKFNIAYEASILSAHRTPEKTINYASSSTQRGLKIIIAAAGGAAHLAGIIAAHTTLPVIGIPIKTQTLNGIDSLYSIVQMPPGVPVATVGINAAKNAGLLAIEILSVSDKKIQEQLKLYKKTQNEEVIKKSEKLKQIGYKEYLKVMEKK